MIIFDFNGFILAHMAGKRNGSYNDGALARHECLYSILQAKLKGGDQYGEVVFACDSPPSWRKQVFPYYKANRKGMRESSPLDWNMIHSFMDEFRNELLTTFPYKVIHIENAEADDIIAAIVQQDPSPHLIVSGDKDFIQLQANRNNVKQWSPAQRKWVTHEDPLSYKINHILEGDRGDGIPNILSEDAVFVTENMRQTKLTASRRADLIAKIKMKQEDQLTEEQKSGLDRNRLLIDLNYVPDYICEEVAERLRVLPKDRNMQKILQYLQQHRLTKLIEEAQNF